MNSSDSVATNLAIEVYNYKVDSTQSLPLYAAYWKFIDVAG
jgi:hypothetical protein